MRRAISHHILLAAALCLTACFGFGEKAEAPTITSMTARNGASWSQQILMRGTVAPAPIPRPSAQLGPYLAAFLSLPYAESSHSAVTGMLAGMSILFQDRGIGDESYALLEEFGLVLQVNLTDQLNRALDRKMALDAYREGLIDVATRAQDRLDELENRQNESNAEVRELRSRASDVQRALNDALRDKDYATAGNRQSESSEVQGELAVATAKQREIGSIISLFEDALDAAAERLQAIDANREALIAGVSVTDVPGAGDLGVLEDAPRGTRTPDPEDVFGSTQPLQ
jgi:hypothetical protein